MSAPDRVLTVCRRAAAAARDRGRPQWVVWRRPASADREAWDDAATEAFRWEQPERGRRLSGRGAEAVLEAAGDARFSALADAAAALLPDLHWIRDAGDAPAPLLVGGAAFAPQRSRDPVWHAFPPARFVLPSQLRWTRSEATPPAEQRAVRVEPGADPAALAANLMAPPPEPRLRTHPCRVRPREGGGAYVRSVAEALAAIGRAELEKVVVARDLRSRADRPLSAAAVLEALARRHPACTIFGVALGNAVFLGASPESLVRLEQGVVRADALAGSAPRGGSAEADARLARRLRESKKEQSEHAVVVRAIRAALEPLCAALQVPESPEVSRLAGIQHLHTPVSGRLRNDLPFPLFALAERLHPTPAVAGAPRPAALAWLRRHEELERGWYAGLVGWVDECGEGELTVALRSALLEGREARLFAGAGIVAGSEPFAELRETELKLRPMLAALGGGEP